MGFTNKFRFYISKIHSKKIESIASFYLWMSSPYIHLVTFQMDQPKGMLLLFETTHHRDPNRSLAQRL